MLATIILEKDEFYMKIEVNKTIRSNYLSFLALVNAKIFVILLLFIAKRKFFIFNVSYCLIRRLLFSSLNEKEILSIW